MKHTRILITGASDGVGKETARALAHMGAVVVLAGRDQAKTEQAAEAIRTESGNPNISTILADLSSMHEVKRMADEFKARYDRLDVLVNNAGAIQMRRRESVDGIELTFALNHLSYFLLTRELLDVLKASAPSRIVNVASAAHYRGHLKFEDIQHRRGYGGQSVYAQSKLANVAFTYELARRLEDTGVTANSLHPGFVRTNFTLNNGWFLRLVYPIVFRKAISVEEGAETMVYLASSPEVEGVTGKYFTKSKQKRSSDESLDEIVQARLWQISEEMIAGVLGDD